MRYWVDARAHARVARTVCMILVRSERGPVLGQNPRNYDALADLKVTSRREVWKVVHMLSSHAGTRRLGMVVLIIRRSPRLDPAACC